MLGFIISISVKFKITLSIYLKILNSANHKITLFQALLNKMIFLISYKHYGVNFVKKHLLITTLFTHKHFILK